MMIKFNLFFYCVINMKGVVIIFRKDIIFSKLVNKDLLYV